jgi:hypothetical protein
MIDMRVDFNRRVNDGHLISSVKRASAPIEVGDRVRLFQPGEDDLEVQATVLDIDNATGKVELIPHWGSEAVWTLSYALHVQAAITAQPSTIWDRQLVSQ